MSFDFWSDEEWDKVLRHRKHAYREGIRDGVVTGVVLAIGYDGEGNPCSTTTYLKGALRERPLIGQVDLNSVTIKLETK